MGGAMRTRTILLVALVQLCAWSAAAEGAPEAPASGTPTASEAASGPAPAAPKPCPQAVADAAVERIQARYDGIRDLAGRFVQTSESVVLSGMSLGEAEASEGTVVFAKPGRMKWHYTQPEESYVISDGRTLWIYDVAAAQASKLSVDGGYLAGAALQFLLGEGKLAESFYVSALRCGDQAVELDLVPRVPATYERLGLTADPVTHLIVDTTITDLFGNRTRIRFEDLVLDSGPKPETFEFSAPAGVEIVDLTQGF